jgi:DNA invertase Pin-like site-specific DNA recombinase
MPYANIEMRRAYDRARNKKRKPHLSLPKAQPRWRRYLTEEEHRDIKRMRDGGAAMTDIAKFFGVSYSTVTHIVYGRKKPRVRG